MPPKSSTEGPGPSKPWKLSFNVVYMKSPSEKSQKLKLTLQLLSTSAMCRYGGTFTIVHVPLTGHAVPLYSVTLPKQTPATDPAMRNHEFVAIVGVDLTLGKQFRIDWSTLNSDGSVATQDPHGYPVANVHP